MASLRVAFAALLLVACADGGGGMVDGGPVPRDSAPRDSGSRTDAGPVTCPSGQHACGAGCIDDLANMPENGCRLGCGERCPTPPDGMASCDAAGACTVGCAPPFRLEMGMCVCAPRTCADGGIMCGSPDNGCGTPLDCGSCAGGGTCLDGACSCPPDAREPNNSRFAAPNIASMTDAPDSNELFSMFNVHAMTDEDWFEISVADDFDAGNPQITVTLRAIPAGSDFDLAAYFICASGGDSSSCTAGTADNMIGRGCASATSGSSAETVGMGTECSGTDDGGSLLIHVTTRTFGGTCGNYQLEVDVH